MNIYITGLGSGYEVEHLVRLFYPMAPLTLTPPEAQILPGHGDFSTFGQEVATNFYIRNALRNA